MTNLLSDIVKFISHRLIGIGLGFALLPASIVPSMLLIFFGVSFGNDGLIVLLGLVSFVLGFAGFQMYKKISKVEFFPALEFCSVIFVTLFWLVRGTIREHIGGISAADLFVVSAFFAIGVIALQGRSKLLRICSGILFSIVSFFVFQNLLFIHDLLVPLLLVASVLLATGVIATLKNQKFLKKFSSVFFSVLFFFALQILIGGFQMFHLMTLAASVFIAIGIMGIYENKNYRKIGRYFMMLGLLCLVFVPLANIWYLKSFGTTLTYFLHTMIYSPLTLPLVLSSVAFLVLSRLMIFYERPQPIKSQDLNNITVAEQKTPNPRNRKRGLSVMVLSQLIFMLAALICALLAIRSWEFFTEYATAFPFIVGVALFALGPALTLYKKPNRLKLLAVVLGSVLLITAAVLQFYPHYIYAPRRPPTYITPYSDYAPPFFLTSILLFAIGYVPITARKIFEKAKNSRKGNTKL